MDSERKQHSRTLEELNSNMTKQQEEHDVKIDQLNTELSKERDLSKDQVEELDRMKEQVNKQESEASVQIEQLNQQVIERDWKLLKEEKNEIEIRNEQLGNKLNHSSSSLPLPPRPPSTTNNNNNNSSSNIENEHNNNSSYSSSNNNKGELNMEEMEQARDKAITEVFKVRKELGKKMKKMKKEHEEELKKMKTKEISSGDTNNELMDNVTTLSRQLNNRGTMDMESVKELEKQVEKLQDELSLRDEQLEQVKCIHDNELYNIQEELKVIDGARQTLQEEAIDRNGENERLMTEIMGLRNERITTSEQLKKYESHLDNMHSLQHQLEQHKVEAQLKVKDLQVRLENIESIHENNLVVEKQHVKQLEKERMDILNQLITAKTVLAQRNEEILGLKNELQKIKSPI